MICAGGTGGGVYPALTVHDALKTIHPQVETLWVGGEGGMEARLVERAGIPFKAIPAAQIHGISWTRIPGNLLAILRGMREARKILNEFKPDVLFFTGGYVAVPMALAGRHLPTLLYVPDIEPGLALKTLARFADRITVTTDDSSQYFKPGSGTVVTGYPIRFELLHWRKPVAQQRLGIRGDLPVLLVFGGSKGARSINMALLESLTALLDHVEIVHISGELDWHAVQAAAGKLNKEQASRYHPYPYLYEDMGAALASADLVVSRAGASVLGELPLFGLPAILVPYPYAWRYQKVNADYLANRGAAIVMEDARLKSGLLLTIEKLLQTPEKLAQMREAMSALHTPDASRKIASQLCDLAGVKHD